MSADAPRWGRWLAGSHVRISLYILAGALAVTYVSRHLFVGLTAGDPGDARIVMTIFEHWRTVILGRAADWRSPLFFFPKTGVLGNTDAFALFGLPYTVARTMFDEFVSYDLALATLFAAGFASMALLLRDGFRLPHSIAILGSILFTVFGSVYQRIIHAQLLAVEIVPLMIWLAIAFSRSNSRREASILAAGGAVAFAAICMTGFYIAWFFTLLIGWAAMVAICMSGVSGSFRTVAGFAKFRRIELTVFAVTLLFALYPFISLYAPRLMENGAQPLSAAFEPSRSQTAWDLIAVGANNYFWGPLLGVGGLGGRISWNPSITPLFAIAMLGGIVAAFLCFRLGDLSPTEHLRVMFVRVFGLGSLLLWMSFVDWGVVKPYVLYYQFVPGGSAMRVPSRLVLLFPAIWVPMVAIGTFWTCERAPRFRWLAYAALAIFIAEQHADHVQPNTDVNLERNRLAAYSPAPARYCESFYVVGQISRPAESESVESYYGPHVDAMILAYRFGIPTLNGQSTLLPPGWALVPMDPQYVAHVSDWISRNKLTHVCRLDLARGDWTLH